MTTALATRPTFYAPSEKEEQHAITKILRAVGFTVGSTAQTRRSKVVLGLPDLVILHPGIRRGGWFECKGYKDRGFRPFDSATWVPKAMSEEQVRFRDLAIASGQLHGWGGRHKALLFLLDLDLAERRGDEIVLRPRGRVAA